MLMARPSSFPGQVVAEHLHVSGQHHQFHAIGIHQFKQPRLSLQLGVRADRDAVERDAVPLRKAGGIRMIGDHRGNFHRQVAVPGPDQQVVQAVVVLGHHHQDPLPAVARLNPPLHPPLPRNRTKPLTQQPGVGLFP